MKKLLLPLLFTVVFCVSGCKNPAQDIVVKISTGSLFKSPLLVHFDNQEEAALGDFAVSITGEDASMVQTGSGGRDFRAVAGMISLALTSEAKPSQENPIIFVVNADIPGYADVSKTIVVTNDSSLVYRIPLSEDLPPVDGAAVTHKETIIRQGVVTENVTLSTVSNPKLSQTASVTLQQNTSVQNSGKNVIPANVLKSHLTLYGLSATSVAVVFPKGLVKINGFDNDGKLIPGGVSYTAAGIFKVLMTAEADTVRYFSQPVQISHELSPNIVNPDTKAPIKAGDVIPLFEGQLGNYKSTTYTATVSTAANGRLVAKYSIPYPSTWVLAWRTSTPVGNLNRNLNINFLPSKTSWTGEHTVLLQTSNDVHIDDLPKYVPDRDFFRQGNTVNGTVTYTTVPGKYGFGLVNVPNITNLKVVVVTAEGKTIGESAVFDSRTTSSIDVQVTVPDPVIPTGPQEPPPPPEFIDITTEFMGKCIGKNIIAPLNSWVTIHNLSDKSFSYIYIKNGVIDQPGNVIKLEVGDQYKISATYQGKAYSTGTFPLRKADMDVPAAAENFSVTTTYSSATNTIKILGELALDCN